MIPIIDAGPGSLLPAGVHDAWIADITGRGHVHVLLPRFGEFVYEAPIDRSRPLAVNDYAAVLVGERSLPITGVRRRVKVEIVHVEETHPVTGWTTVSAFLKAISNGV